MDPQWEPLISTSRNRELLSDFAPGVPIGKGGFAMVFRAVRIFDEKYFSVKVYNKTDKKASKTRTELLRAESQLLRSLRHPAVVSFSDFRESPTHIFIVTEYCNGGDVCKYLQSRGGDQRLPEHEVVSAIRDVLQALAFIHERKVVHRDIKPENILIVKHEKTDALISAKLADFGLSAQLENTFLTQLSRRCGSWAYAAPELLKKEPYTEVSSDSSAEDRYLWHRNRHIHHVVRETPFRAHSQWQSGHGKAHLS